MLYSNGVHLHIGVMNMIWIFLAVLAAAGATVLSVAQSKLNVLNATWKGFLSDLTKNKADIVADLGL